MRIAFGLISVLIVLGLVCPASAQVKKRMVCHGDLPVHAIDRAEKEVPLKRDINGFEATSDDWVYLKIGVDKALPYIEVSPWLGIQSLNHAKKFERELIVEYNSDGETFFAASVTGRRSKFSSTLNCEVRIDDRFPAAAKIKSGRPKVNSASKKTRGTR